MYNLSKTDNRFNCSLCKLCRTKPEGYKTRRAFIKHNAKHHPDAMRFRDRINNDLDDIEYNSDDEEEEEEEEE